MGENLSEAQIKQMIDMLKNMLPEEQSDDKDEPVQESPIRTRGSRKPKFVENKFDSMSEKNLHKADIAIDQKLNKYGPTPRTRTFKAIKVKCRVCGKTEEINPVLLSDTPERYKCNACARSAG
jgi:hypothetical protein|tara:strand:- start:11161 stop:11529 length:369 start_codon:yes stop_codon:yes gene_type:complete